MLEPGLLLLVTATDWFCSPDPTVCSFGGVASRMAFHFYLQAPFPNCELSALSDGVLAAICISDHVRLHGIEGRAAWKRLKPDSCPRTLMDPEALDQGDTRAQVLWMVTAPGSGLMEF